MCVHLDAMAERVELVHDALVRSHDGRARSMSQRGELMLCEQPRLLHEETNRVLLSDELIEALLRRFG